MEDEFPRPEEPEWKFDVGIEKWTLDRFTLDRDVYDDLFPHQRSGVAWMWGLFRDELGGVLADEMGVGKTRQVIAFVSGLLGSRLASRVLIVVPQTLLRSWTKEARKCGDPFSPYKLDLYHGSKSKERLTRIDDILKRGGVCLTTYGMVQHHASDLGANGALGKQFQWDEIVLDEGDKIRNPKAKISMIMRTLPAKCRLLLSGTPIQNNLVEYWSLLDFVCCGKLLGNEKRFRMEFEEPIVRGRYRNANDRERALGVERAMALRHLVAPHVLRREKAQVFDSASPAPIDAEPAVREQLCGSLDDLELLELMDDIDADANAAHCSDSSDKEDDSCRESAILNISASAVAVDAKFESQAGVVNLSEGKVLRVGGAVPRKDELVVWVSLVPLQLELYSKFLQSKEVQAALMSKVSPLVALMALQRICNHPRLLLSSASESGFGLLELRNTFSKTDCSAATLIAQSCKLRACAQLLGLLKAEGHRVLVFSVSLDMLDMCEIICADRKYSYLRLDGSVSKAAERQKLVDKFNDHEGIFMFLLSIKVGGLGLNLTGADRAILLEPGWNPSTQAQAVDRIHRFGQTRDVVVYRLICAGALEEKMYRKQLHKGGLVDVAMRDGDTRRMRRFTRADLTDLFQLDDHTRSLTHERFAATMKQRHTLATSEQHIVAIQGLPGVVAVSDHQALLTCPDDVWEPCDDKEVESLRENVERFKLSFAAGQHGPELIPLGRGPDAAARMTKKLLKIRDAEPGVFGDCDSDPADASSEGEETLSPAGVVEVASENDDEEEEEEDRRAQGEVDGLVECVTEMAISPHFSVSSPVPAAGESKSPSSDADAVNAPVDAANAPILERERETVSRELEPRVVEISKNFRTVRGSVEALGEDRAAQFNILLGLIEAERRENHADALMHCLDALDLADSDRSLHVQALTLAHGLEFWK